MPTFVVAFFIIFEFQDKPIYLLTIKDYRRLNGNPPFIMYFVASIVILLAQVIFSLTNQLFLLFPLDLLSLAFCLWMGFEEIPFLSRDKKFLLKIFVKKLKSSGLIDHFNGPLQEASKYVSQDGKIPSSGGALKRKESLSTIRKIKDELRYMEFQIGFAGTMERLAQTSNEQNYRLAQYLLDADANALIELIEYFGSADITFLAVDFSKFKDRIETIFSNLIEYIDYVLKLDYDRISFRLLYLTFWRLNVLLTLKKLNAVQKRFNKRIVSKLSTLGMNDPKARTLLLYIALCSLFPSDGPDFRIGKLWFIRPLMSYGPYDTFMFNETFLGVGLLIAFYVFYLTAKNIYDESEKKEIDSFLSQRSERWVGWKSRILASLAVLISERPLESLARCLSLFKPLKNDQSSPFALDYLLNNKQQDTFKQNDVVDFFLEIFFFAEPSGYFNVHTLISELEKPDSKKLKDLIVEVLEERWLKKTQNKETSIRHDTKLLDFYRIPHISIEKFKNEDLQLLVTLCEESNKQVLLKNTEQDIKIEKEWAKKFLVFIKKRNSGIYNDNLPNDPNSLIATFDFYRNYFVAISDKENVSDELKLDVDLFIPVFGIDLEKHIESMIRNSDKFEYISTFADIKRKSDQKFFTNIQGFSTNTGSDESSGFIDKTKCEIFPGRFIWRQGAFFFKVSVDEKRGPIMDLTNQEADNFIAANFKMESNGLYRYTDPSKTLYGDAMVTYDELQRIVRSYYKYVSFGCRVEIYIKIEKNEKQLFLIKPKKENK